MAVAVIAAVILDLAAYWTGQAADASTVIKNTPYDLNAGVVAAASVIPLLIGIAVVSWLHSSRPVLARRLAWTGLLVALLSSVSPFAMAQDTATALTLTTMHVIVGLAWAAITLFGPNALTEQH
ncbi:DUF6069 family protein [Streptomyces sp. AD681]|nr:DUF6069 family protein [Streptomyces sp. AD681]MDA5147417.1 DUF6069 family protein [Streptomyces sp. AD681]